MGHIPHQKIVVDNCRKHVSVLSDVHWIVAVNDVLATAVNHWGLHSVTVNASVTRYSNLNTPKINIILLTKHHTIIIIIIIIIIITIIIIIIMKRVRL